MIYYLFYNLAFSLVLLLGAPYLLFRMAATRRFREGLAERLGLYRSGRFPREGSIWIQAASVGEVNAARPLIGLIREEFPRVPVVLTCQTAAGRAVAGKRLAGEVTAILSPLDFAPAVGRLIRLISPRILILIETELWPGTIMAAGLQGVPVAVVNGRISSRSFPRYRKARALLQPLLRRIDGFGMRSEEDASRIRELGAEGERVRVTGNIKFDSLDLSASGAGGERVGWGWRPEDPVIVAGSTYEGEEELLLTTYRELRDEFPGLRLILAPRHLERVGAVEELLRSAGEGYRLYSRLSGSDAETGLVILDRMGVLSGLYREAAVVFVGRSLRGTGGQNPIEPAAAGKPVVFGPHMENFSEIAAGLAAAGAAVRAEDGAALTDRIREILSDREKGAAMGERGRAEVEKRQGASRRNLEMIRGIIR